MNRQKRVEAIAAVLLTHVAALTDQYARRLAEWCVDAEDAA